MPRKPDREALILLIDGRRYTGWNDIEIERSIDAFSTVSFTAPFEPERREFRDVFRPFSFKPLALNVNGDTQLFAGTLVGVDPKFDPSSRSVGISAYGRPAVLADVTMPASAYPLELNGLALGQLAEKVCFPFGLSTKVDGPAGAAFDRVAIKPDESPLTFLAELAKQRGFVISETPQGGVHFVKSVSPGRPVGAIREGTAPLVSITPTFQPQSYFSEITGLVSSKPGRTGGRYTARNTKLRGVVRPTAFAADDTEKGDIPAATRAKLGRMFGNMVSYEISGLPGWRDPKGELWSPNTTVLVTAPNAMIYRETEMLIRDVKLKQSAESTSASLTVVLPGAFSGEIPERLPWDE